LLRADEFQNQPHRKYLYVGGNYKDILNMKQLLFFFSLLLTTNVVFGQKQKKLLDILGPMPKKPALQIDTLERTKLDNGWRYRIKYLAEDTSKIFHTPKDYMYAYLFVPNSTKDKKLPAIVAVHQDGNHNYLGYLETAGIAGDDDQHYGVELFNRGYIVICPDRFLHAERRRIAKPDTLADVFDQADIAEQHWVGQLQLTNRNFINKEVYDLILTTDVLCNNPNVDKNRIGAIGHSAGGYVLGYFMFVDKRIKVGASSCGVFEIVDWFAEDAIRKRNVLSVIPGLATVGRTSDYIGLIAPRPFLMTRGMSEWGNGDDKQRIDSKRHVEGTQLLDAEARKYYKTLGADKKLKTIYFDENGGGHSFPPKVKEEVYKWLDSYLKE
jgi:dienelactone hydrolase